jgi:hypothetical protein
MEPYKNEEVIEECLGFLARESHSILNNWYSEYVLRKGKSKLKVTPFHLCS